MKPIILAVLVAAAAPSKAVEFDAAVAEGLTIARAAAETGEDMALAALYQRLFVLQDKRRETELRSDEADLAIDDLVLVYYKFDDRMTKPQLKAIAADPNHRDYPNNTESEKLKLLGTVREKLRVQKLGELELKRIARDTEEVKSLIAEYRGRPRTP